MINLSLSLDKMEYTHPKNGIIGICGMEFFAYHGVYPEEREKGSLFSVDLWIGTDMTEAIEEDDLDGTIDYAHIYELIESLMKYKCGLIEHLAGKIMKVIYENNPRIKYLKVKVTKHSPAIRGNVKSTFVELEKNF